MHLIIGRYFHGEGEAIRKSGLGKQFFGLLYIDIVDIRQRIIIVCLQVRNHRGAELCADTVIDCVYDAVSVNRIVDRLPYTDVIEGFCRIVQIERLHRIRVADIDNRGIRRKLLGNAGVRHEALNRAGLEIHQKIRRARDELDRYFVKMRGRSPVILEFFKRRVILHSVVGQHERACADGLFRELTVIVGIPGHNRRGRVGKKIGITGFQCDGDCFAVFGRDVLDIVKPCHLAVFRVLQRVDDIVCGNFLSVVEFHAVCLRVIRDFVIGSNCALECAVRRNLDKAFINVEVNALCVRGCCGEGIEVVDFRGDAVDKIAALLNSRASAGVRSCCGVAGCRSLCRRGFTLRAGCGRRGA